MKRTAHRVTRTHHKLVDSNSAHRTALVITIIIGLLLFVLFLTSYTSVGAAESAADVTISAAISPNTNSASWEQWSANAIQAIQTGETTMGDPSLPTYYEELPNSSTVDPSLVISSSFRSWHGKANPGTVFGNAFANENGNTLRFIYFLKAKPGTKIDVVNGVSIGIKPNAWKIDGVGPVVRHEYLSSIIYQNILVGIDYGADGTLGGGDDTIRTEGTGPVDAIIGTFTTFPELSTSASVDPENPGEQLALDTAIASTTALGNTISTFQMGYSTDQIVEANAQMGLPPTPTTIPTPTNILTPTPDIMNVVIDIRPNTLQNRINLKGRGMVGVAILSAPGFNPKNIDSDTILFAGASPVRVNMRDVNRDRVKDMIVYFKSRQLNIDPSAVTATLTGSLKDGTKFSGTDTVKIFPQDQRDNDEGELED